MLRPLRYSLSLAKLKNWNSYLRRLHFSRELCFCGEMDARLCLEPPRMQLEFEDRLTNASSGFAICCTKRGSL